MKKLLVLLMSLMLLSGCGGEKPSDDVTETPNVSFNPQDVVRYAGYALNGEYPTAVWVDFDKTNDTAVGITLSGYKNSAVMDKEGEALESANASINSYIGKSADELKDLKGSAIEEAYAMAANSYLSNKDQLVIREYQSVMSGRYVANSPYIVANETLSGDVKVNAEIVAAYPSDCIELVSEDVMSGDKVKFPQGNNVAKFANANSEEYTITTPVFLAKKPGVAVIAYEYDGHTIYSALDIYENFTTELSGADAYGKVVYEETKENEAIYRALGDKAMNFPGGTCGPTVVDVVIDTTNDTIKSVNVYESSDSTYLANPWEYNGGFVATGEFIKDMDAYTAKFVGLSTKSDVIPYVLTDADHPDGGSVVEGGVDYVVSGATRTANAVVYAVNAVLEAYNK